MESSKILISASCEDGIARLVCSKVAIPKIGAKDSERLLDPTPFRHGIADLKGIGEPDLGGIDPPQVFVISSDTVSIGIDF